MKGFVTFLVVCVIALVIYAIFFTDLPADVISPFRPPNP